MAIHDLKGQIGRLPRAAGRLSLPRTRPARRCTSARRGCCATACAVYLGAQGHESAHRRAAARRRRARGHRHRLGRRGAGAREPAHQAAQSALQRPAARRQDVSLSAAHDDRARAAPAGGPPGRARRQRLRRPVHAGRRRAPDDDRWRTGCSASARATRSSTAGADRPCLEYDIKRCLAPCVESICTIEQYRPCRRSGAAADRRAAGRAHRRACATRCARRPATSGSSAPRTCATRSGPSRRCATGATRSRRRRWATATRSASRSARPARSCRSFRCAAAASCDRIELVDRRRADPVASTAGSERRTVLDAPRAAAVLRGPRRRRRRCTCRSTLDAEDSEALEAWLSASAPAAACASSCRSAARSAACWIWRRATRRWRTSRISATARPLGLRGARRRCAPCLHLPALPRRIECFDISTLQGRETVASMVVAVEAGCDAASTGSSESGACWRCRAPANARRSIDSRMTSRRCTRSSCAGTVELLEQGGPFPDLILIDGGKGQLTRRLRGASRSSGSSGWSRSASRSRKSCCSRATASKGIALPHESAALRLLQRIRDEAHRFAVTFHRRSRTQRDLRSELDDIAGHRRAPAQAAADDVRIGRRRPAREPRRTSRPVGRRQGGRRGDPALRAVERESVATVRVALP